MRTLVFAACALIAAMAYSAEDAMLQRAKLELVVEQAGEMLAEANRKGSATHTAAHQFYFGLVYGSGTNLLARKESVRNTQLKRKYMDLIEKNYAAYTKVKDKENLAASTGSNSGKSGSRHRAKRVANAEKLGDKELMAAIREWESFVVQLKKTR